MPTLIKSFETGGDFDEPVGNLSSVEYDFAQSFSLDATATIYSVELYLKKVNTITDPITVTIETSTGAPSPSGTLVNASATQTIAPSSSSYSWVSVVFPATFSLTGSTKYWIKCVVGNQSANNYYGWYRNTGGGYASHGESASVSGGAFDTEGVSDLYFRIYEVDQVLGGFVFTSY